MKHGVEPAVLRDVAMQAHVRMLARPAGPPGVGVERRPTRSPGQLFPAPRSDAEPAGLAEGYEVGRQQGLRDGEAEGLRAAQAQCEDALQRSLEAHRRDAVRLAEASNAERSALDHRFERILGDLQCAADEQFRRLESQAVALAFEAVCQLLGTGFGTSEQLAAGIARAMAARREKPFLRVRVRPDAIELLSSSRQGRALLERHPAIEWLADPTLKGDGCMLDGEAGSVDASMATQLGRLRDLWSSATDDPQDGAQRGSDR